MQKRIFPFIVLITAVFCLNSAAFAQEDGIEISKANVILACLSGDKDKDKDKITPKECEDSGIIEIKTSINKSVKDPQFQYSVSAGEIDGKGESVKWKLTDVRPGTYRISVNVTNKATYLRTFFKDVTVSECPNCATVAAKPKCECAEFSLGSSAAKVKEGEVVTFTANLNGGSQTNVKYEWQLTRGKIIEGKGTSTIKVETKGLAGKAVVAVLEIEGDVCTECLKTAASVVQVE